MNWQGFHQATLETFEQRLRNELATLPALPAPLPEAMRYSLLAGGKRIRPVLVYATGRMLDLPESALHPIAIAVECIHTYSLIHDDLPAMDNDELRRGKPTCHIAFDEATAILAGDALQAMAFEIISDAPELSYAQKIKAIKSLSSASGVKGMCGGQSMDLAFTDKPIEKTQLEKLHRLKTGALISSAISVPVLISDNANQELVELFDKYANSIGLAFQVQDDILDVVGDTAALGKPQGSDQSANKSTYPELMGLQAAQQYLHELIEEALQALQAMPYNTDILQSFTEYLAKRNH